MLSENLRRLRHDAGLTQAELAIQSSVKQTTISAIELGTTTDPRCSTITGLVRGLMKPLGWTKQHVMSKLMV